MSKEKLHYLVVDKKTVNSEGQFLVIARFMSCGNAHDFISTQEDKADLAVYNELSGTPEQYAHEKEKAGPFGEDLDD